MIGVFVSSVVDLGFKPLSDQTKDWKINNNKIKNCWFNDWCVCLKCGWSWV
jgi:hypothetical protein